MTRKYLNVGGLISAGFDPSGQYLLTISHSGRGVFSTDSWELVARDSDLAYPENGVGVGIGPIAGERIEVYEKDYEKDFLHMISPDGRFLLKYTGGRIEVKTQS